MGVSAPARTTAHAPTPEQLKAADPELSAFVAASAGSGKTQVLTDRVLRLLLAGATPQRILCITYTKAAAGEMANRIVDRLAQMATAGSEERVALLRTLLDRAPEENELRRAARLFADVLDAPGGLKIQTIHAFCQSVLARFPLEADLAPHFGVVDERDASELMAEAVRAVMRAPGSERVAAALGLLTEQAHENQAGALLAGLIGSAGKLREALEAYGGPDGLVGRIRELVGAAPGETEEDAWVAMVRGPAMDEAGLRRAARVLTENGSKTAIERGLWLTGFLGLDETARLDAVEDYVEVWLTRQRLPRKESSLWTVACANADSGICEVLLAERDRIHAAWLHMCAVRIAEATGALVTVADRVTAEYERLKRARAALDYDDLIFHMRRLVADPERAPWVLYKLDGGLDHVLIDEAQDTNHDQWDIVARLTAEFFAGAGTPARSSGPAAPRSVFAVGDPKQSIYSFQGADPDAFDAAEAQLSARVQAARGEWAHVPLARSFRSTAAVLAAVDAVANTGALRAGLYLRDGERLHHEVTRTGEAGLVELWPLISPPEEADPGRWSPPVEPEPGDTPKGLLARRVAARIKRMIGAEQLESRGRPVRAGDILVLVRARDALVEELIRQLKEIGVPVAGRDRLKLTEHLAVKDLLALGEVMLLPEDDLVLATVLKSPLVGYDDEALYEIAHGREGRLWDALGERAREAPASLHAHARAWLEGLRDKVDFLTPFAFFDLVLNDTADPAAGGAHGLSGRARLIARLGYDAADPIDELLALAQAEERTRPPSMQGFLFRLRTADIEIKRELEQAGADAVRVMTVHGAKGLQAPIVFLPDTAAEPAEREALCWFTAEGAPAVPLWLRSAANNDAIGAEARAEARRRAAAEHHRLLYVAMTRAEDRLYIAGAHGKIQPPAGCWYRLIEAGLEGLLEEAEDPEIGSVRRLTCRQVRAVAENEPEAGPPQPEPLPAWANRPAPPEPRPPRPLAPSRPDDADPPVRSPLDEAEMDRPAGRGWGIAAHRLLQRLPELPAEQRAGAAARYLAARHADWPAEAQAALAGEVLAILDHPGFAALFGPGSLAEAPIVGVLDDGHVVAGQVDRLLVRDDEVLVVDYKTNRRPPARAGDVPAAYLRQMGAYRAVLGRMFPDRPVACALLWTDGPTLMPIPADLLGFGAA